MKKFFYMLVVMICIIMCSCKVADHYNEEKRHHFYPDPSNTLENFTEVETQQILNAFDIVVPVHETNTYVRSVTKEINRDNISSIVYIIEIGGVNDYVAFFENNIHLVWENGLAGRSMNETLIGDQTSYYITYVHRFYDMEDPYKGDGVTPEGLDELYVQLKKARE